MGRDLLVAPGFESVAKVFSKYQIRFVLFSNKLFNIVNTLRQLFVVLTFKLALLVKNVERT